MERARRIKEILIGNLEKPPSLLELARISGTNKNKLNTDFRRVYGISVFEFLRASRLEHARALLESKKMNVTEAAFEVGYAHQQSFTRAFRSHFGTNPTDHVR
jgi:AraC family transcriptional activator of pyochelin receptor